MLQNQLDATKFTYSFLSNIMFEAYRILLDSYNDILNSSNKYSMYNENGLRDDLVKIAETKSKYLQFVWDTESRDLQNDNVRIDISIIYSLDLKFVNERLSIECKIIDKNNVKDYVDRNGIISYVECKYNATLPLAGMLGFIIYGNINNQIDQINKILKSHARLKTNIYLTRLQNQTNEFYSNHDRFYKNPPINIYHLMLDYTQLI